MSREDVAVRLGRAMIVGLAGVGLFLGLAAPATAQESARDRRRTPVVEVVERCRDAVVNISTARVIQPRGIGGIDPFDMFEFRRPARPQRVTSVGSGVVIHERGFIVTNAHVVAQTSDVQVTFADKSTAAAEIVAVDAEHDLAVLRVRVDRPLPAIRMGRSHDLMIGETVVAIGNPLGYQHSVSTGILSAEDRSLSFGGERVQRGLLQTDAAINPGNSGGPLLNIEGELIGINTAIRGDAQNVGFAIPVDRLWDLLPEMLDIERHARVRFGLLLAGAEPRVVAVRPASPAAGSGLRRGDRIERIDGEPVRDGIDYYVRLLSRQPGTRVELEARRGDGLFTARVPLEAVPLPDGGKLADQLLGMKLVEAPENVRRRLELPQSVGLIVESVSPRGPAAREGIRAGDVIVRAGRFAVPDLVSLGLVLEAVKPGDAIMVEGLRLQADPPIFWRMPLVTMR